MSILIASAGVQAAEGDRSSAQSPTVDDSVPSKPAWFRPFQWKNPPEDQSPQASAGIAAVIATDFPQQPTSIQAAFSQEDIPQLAPTKLAVSPVTVPASQGRNPFNWTNQSESVGNVTDSTQQNESVLSQPFHWSNDLQGAEPPQDFTPPEEEMTLGAAIIGTLQWQQPGGDEDSADSLTDGSSPPANATDEQMAQWEQEKFPWIRPFYWSNEASAQLPTQIASETKNGAIAWPPDSVARQLDTDIPFLARPFMWTNKTATVLPSESFDPRTVAYFHDGEELPQPAQVPNEPSSLPPINVPSQTSPSETGSLQKQDGESGDGGKGVLAEAETLGREPEDTSLQFLRASTVLLEPGEAQYDYGMTYSLFDLTLPVIIDSTLELARFRRRELLVPLEVRYGLTRRIQLFLNVPFGWSNTELSLSALDEFGNDGGIGDIVFGGTILLRQGDGKKSDAILTLAATAPTGKDPFASVVGLSPSAPSLGGGTWSISASSLFIRSYDPVVVFYGVGTRQHFLRDVNGVNFRRGQEYNYQMGIGFGINERITLSTRFNGSYVTEARVNSQRILGSIQEPMAIGLAMTIARKKYLVEPFIDFGLTNDSNDVRFGITWTR